MCLEDLLSDLKLQLKYAEDKPTLHGDNYRYVIQGEPDKDGMFTVPARGFIPEMAHGMRVKDREIAWQKEMDDYGL